MSGCMERCVRGKGGRSDCKSGFCFGFFCCMRGSGAGGWRLEGGRGFEKDCVETVCGGSMLLALC